MNVFQDQGGNWVAIREIRFSSGAKGYERITVIKRGTDPFAQAELREEAEERARRAFGIEES
jgi:hypothetical protein